MKALKANKWQSVCTVSDLVSGSGICALVHGEQVAIFSVPTSADGKPALYAIGNWDPIGKANVLSRGILADIGGAITVASPLYKQHYNLATGQCQEDDSVSVPVYEIAVDGDTVVIGS